MHECIDSHDEGDLTFSSQDNLLPRIDLLTRITLLSQVYVFDFHKSTPTGNEYQIQVIQELEGKQAGEYFGAAICVLDVNGDGLDDILVGAPHYGAAKIWDQGRIYVFLTTVIPT
jgi:hypothetical protein